MALFGSKAPGYYRVVKFEVADAAAFDGTVANLKANAPDILGYTGTKMRVVQTGPTEGVIIVEGRDQQQMDTHVSMTEELRDGAIAKFGIKIDPCQGKVVWSS